MVTVLALTLFLRDHNPISHYEGNILANREVMRNNKIVNFSEETTTATQQQ